MRHPAWRLLALGILIAILIWFVSTSGMSQADLRPTVESWGVAAPLAYCILGALLMVGFVPFVVVAGAAGLIFGIPLGFPVALVVAIIGAGLAFSISRWLGGAAVDEIQSQRIARVRKWIADRGVLAVIAARIAPIPSQVVSYAGGLTTLPLRTFLVGSLLGFTPRTFAYVAVGGSLDEPSSPVMLGALALLAVVVTVGAVVARRDRSASHSSRRAPRLDSDHSL